MVLSTLQTHWVFADQQKIRKWLSAPDPSSNHYDAVKKRGPETGLWLINGELLRNWKMSPHSFAWLYGIRMASLYVKMPSVTDNYEQLVAENRFYGQLTVADRYLQKSKLIQPFSSTVIEEVANHCKENPDFALAYFYFDFTDPVKQKTSFLVRSFLTQLSFQLPMCSAVLLKLHAACQGGSQQASPTGLMKALNL